MEESTQKKIDIIADKERINTEMEDLHTRIGELEGKCKEFEAQKKQIQKDLEKYKIDHDTIMTSKETQEAKLKEQNKLRKKLHKRIGNQQKKKEKQTQEMRDKIKKLEEQKQAIEDLERNQVDLKGKTRGIMRSVDHEYGTKKQLEREQEALERKKGGL